MSPADVTAALCFSDPCTPDELASRLAADGWPLADDDDGEAWLWL